MEFAPQDFVTFSRMSSCHQVHDTSMCNLWGILEPNLFISVVLKVKKKKGIEEREEEGEKEREKKEKRKEG